MTQTITQVHISKGVRFFEQAFIEKYKFSPITDTEAPAVFIGMYDQDDYNKLFNYVQKETLAIVVFCGSDAMHLNNPLRFREGIDLFKAKNVKIIATSKFIEEDLKKEGLQYVSYPVTPITGETFNPVSFYGPCIYLYCPMGKEDQYGLLKLEEYFEVYPGEFRFAFNGKKYAFPLIRGYAACFPKAMMPQIYASCFMGLRLTEHDGLSTTVAEMGLMGIPSIYNGNLPGSIMWQNTEEDMEFIKECIVAYSDPKYMKKETKAQIAWDMRNYLRLNDPFEWLNEEFYLNKERNG